MQKENKPAKCWSIRRTKKEEHMVLPTKPQFPVNGRLNKDFKVTSPFGFRMHPIQKKPICHNGVDIWGAKEPLLIEAFYDGKVIASTTNMASFGHYVVIRHKIDGKSVTSLYAHLKSPSKLKKGQKVDAGTVVGIMGATGPVTGKHLHFEIGRGANHPFVGWGGDGSRYYDPMKFIKSCIKKWEAAKEVAESHVEALQPAPTGEVAPLPAHSEPSDVLETAAPVARVKVAKPAVAKAPVKKTK